MPIQFDYAVCAMGVDEAPEMVLDTTTTDVREISNSDFRDITDFKLEEDIQRYSKLVQTMKTRDNNLKLELRLQALVSEKSRREKRSKANVLDKAEFIQSSEKRGFTFDLHSADRSSKLPRVDPVAAAPAAPAFQTDLQIHRFPRDAAKKSGKAEVQMKPASRTPTPSKDENASNFKKIKKSGGKGSSKAVKESPDTVILFSSDDESLGDAEKVERINKSTRRTSSRIAEKRRVESHQKIAYPSRGDPDAVEVYYRDLKHLGPMEFLNDTVIDFYIKYIQRPEVLEPERKERFHFFNSFFFRKLGEAFEADKQEEAFGKLRKWTRGVEIFEKSYLFLPINDKLHWSLAIVAFSVSDCSSDVLIPHIFHLDSFENIHSSTELFKILKRYLESEHKQMQCPAKVSWDKMVTKRVEVPRQENEYDCGLFLLYYIQCFVETAPLPCKLTEETNLFGKRWFRPSRASSLRHKIKEILEQLFEEEILE